MKYILGLRSASLCCHGNAKLLVLSERQVAFGSGHRLSWFSSVSPDRYCSSTLDLFLSLQTAVHYTQYAVHPISAVHYTLYALQPSYFCFRSVEISSDARCKTARRRQTAVSLLGSEALTLMCRKCA